jgi:hypothetical protein
VLVVVTAAIAGILPALHATRRRAGGDIRQLGGSTGLRLGRMWSALMVGVAAAYGPARRSLRIQPTEALRAE